MRWLLLAAMLALSCDKPPARVDAEPKADPKPHLSRPLPSPVPEVEALTSLDDPEHMGRSGDGRLHVTFFDVGDGDSTLVVSPTGKTILIDAGPRHAQERLRQRLSDTLANPIDLFVLGSPSAEHAGGAPLVLKTVGAKRYLDAQPRMGDESYVAALAQVKAANVERFRPVLDQPVAIGGGAKLSVIHVPTDDSTGMIFELRFGETALLLEGDCTIAAEAEALSRHPHLGATLLHVASHGADGPTSVDFLVAVKPAAAIISVGPADPRGAPSRRVVERLQAAGARVLRTDLDGDVFAVSDGRAFTVTVGRPAVGADPRASSTFGAVAAAAEPASARTPAKKTAEKVTATKTWVASAKSKVFHVPSCSAAKRIKPENLITFRSREEAMKNRTPAGDCHP